MSLEFTVDKSVTQQRRICPNLLQYASDNRKEDYFNDVTIKAGSLNIAANRLVLSSQSRYFEAMFKSKMKERYEPVIEVKGVDEKSVKDLIDYIYTGSVEINGSNIVNLLHAADYLQLEDVKGFCFDFLKSIVSTDNCFAVLSAAYLFRSDSLKNRVHQHISSNFDDIAFTDSFKSLAFEDLTKCISSLNRSQASETSIYQAIICWTKHNESRKKEFPGLFKLLNLYNLPSEYLEDVVSTEELVTDFPVCCKTTLDVFSKLLKDKRRKEKATKIVSFGGKRNWKKVFVVFNSIKLLQPDFSDLPFEVEFCSFLEMYDYVYCIGGQTKGREDKKSASNVVRKMNMSDEVWKLVSPMNEKRYLMGCTAMHGSLIVAGGYSGKKSIASAEYYQPIADEWKMLPPMIQCRCDNALVSHNGIIYSLGGWCDGKYLSSVEQLRDFTRSWENAPSMQTPRRWLAAVNCDGVIYAIGGKSGEDKNTRLKSVEKFDFIQNEWVYVKDMKYERSALAATVLHGRIFVVGGLDVQEYDSVKEIECYDPSKDAWTVVGSTDDELFHHSVFAL